MGRRVWLAALVTVLVLGTVLGTGVTALQAAASASPSAVDGLQYLPLVRNGVAPLCRFGVNGAVQSYPVQPLRLSWYVDYQATRNANPPSGIDYYPMIRLEPIGDSYDYSIYVNRAPTTDADLSAVIDANPGTYWFIGNEPDRKQYQDNLKPEVYARAYHDLYARIKGQDPNAKIVAGTIVQPTPVRLQYLDRVLQAYHEQYLERMPVDVWSFHNFILNEANCAYYNKLYPDRPDYVSSICWGADIPPGLDDIADGLRIDVQDNDDIELFKQQVIAFRQWLAERGYRNTPVFLSEFGILMPEGLFRPDFDAPRVNAFMDASFDFLLNASDPETGFPGDANRLVQRFSWYSMTDKVDHNGYLFDSAKPVNDSRSAYGTNFANFTGSLPEEIDFYPVSVAQIGVPPLVSQGATTVTLEAVIANSGNLAEPQQVEVRFYRGNPAAGGLPIGEPQTITLAGCGEQQTVSLEWADVAPGSYTIYVVVDADERVGETDESNNVLNTAVRFARHRLQTPLVLAPFNLP
jgi:hypothetical protein